MQEWRANTGLTVSLRLSVKWLQRRNLNQPDVGKLDFPKEKEMGSICCCPLHDKENERRFVVHCAGKYSEPMLKENAIEFTRTLLVHFPQSSHNWNINVYERAEVSRFEYKPITSYR